MPTADTWPLDEYRALANERQAQDAPCLADLREEHAAKKVVTAYTAWKLAGKPHVR